MTGRMFERPGPGVLVAEIYLDRTPNVGNMTKTRRYMSIDYEVIESNASEREEIDDDDDDDMSDDDSYNSSDRRRLFIRYSGTVRITKTTGCLLKNTPEELGQHFIINTSISRRNVLSHSVRRIMKRLLLQLVG